MTLPVGWDYATIEELAGPQGLTTDGDWIESKDQDPDGDVRLVQLADVGEGVFRDRSARFVTRETVKRLNCTLLNKGDVLIARMPDPLGRACVFPGVGQPAITAVDVFIWRSMPDGPSASWLMHFVNCDDIRRRMAEQAGGTTRQRISGGRVKQLQIPVPPLREQRRIAAKIDAASGKSKRSRDHLDHVTRLVEKYKQAILTVAFRGELTREWREANATEVSPKRAVLVEEREQLLSRMGRIDRKRSDVPIDVEDQPHPIPLGWEWVRAESVTGFITKGTTPSAVKMTAGSGMVPFVKVYNLTFDGSLDFKVDPTFISVETHRGELRRSIVRPGDILMNIVGPPLGKVSVVPDQWPEWNINQAIAVFNPIKSLDARYVARWLSSGVVLDWAMKKAKATAGQSNLTLELCRDLPVPLCSVAEQQEMIRIIDIAFAWTDRLAAEATSARKLIDHLDRAILAKAFRGELVPQDPNDEPASVLLDRIKAERAGSVGQTRRRSARITP